MSRRVTAILEAALQEDRATSDATTYACIDVNQRASATILAKQDCAVAGIGSIGRVLDVFATLDGTVASNYEVTHNSKCLTACDCAAGSQSPWLCTTRVRFSRASG